MSLTPEAVRAVTFDKAPFGKRGYHEDQVDDFLDLVEAALAGKGTLSSAEVRRVVFDAAPLVKRGYNEDQVDAFLDMVATEMDERDEPEPHNTEEILPVASRPAQATPAARAPGQSSAPMRPMPAVRHAPGQTSAPGRPQVPARPAAQPPTPHDAVDERVTDGQTIFLPLPPAPPGIRGYRPGEVERLARALAHAATKYDGRPTSAEIANTRLNLTFFAGHGYDPAAVDALIAAWTKELRHRES
ncbi:DivIVA domain-containing protein [Actinokineospora alba]|uniref:Cell wall synthesis protein Wag31 n=1 Tax=Actinokineospora alba TaxID=504798 RepID=A0A1H0RZR3_9PSEU|nr:DivIVA domain-containing protein [Actinokineospora alba]TDP66833.1 DivIVA domain-containing protein [Actinokineospora alba]SDI48519.1 DivIVA domain-containing protein [Actinokineospora alba]SDP35082.1 DivIVA domain-containing protein [Actinokineospora alba]